MSHIASGDGTPDTCSPSLLGLPHDRPEDDREALLARLKIVYRTPPLRARRWEFQLEMGRITGAIVAERRGLQPDDLGSRVTAAAAFTAIEVAMDHWQQHDGREDLSAVLDAAIGHLGHAFGD